jgi:hypothetical protein
MSYGVRPISEDLINKMHRCAKLGNKTNRSKYLLRKPGCPLPGFLSFPQKQ